MKAKDLSLDRILRFHPDKGIISFLDGRMLIVDSQAMGLIRRELIHTLGRDLARGLLVRWGYKCGFNDAKKLETMFPWDTETDWILAGPVMHNIEGIVQVEPEWLEYDRAKGSLYMMGRWTHSYEVEEHLRYFSKDTSPVCWTLAGYASGYASCFMKSEMVCIESTCQGKGDEYCRWIIRPKAEWGSECDQMIQDLEEVDLTAMIQTLEKRVETKTVQLLEAQRNLSHMERLASAGGMASLLAHEINGPLQIIQANLDLLITEHTHKDEARVERTLREACSEIKRLRSTLRRVLESTRPHEPQLQPVNVNVVVNEIRNFLLMQLGAKGIRLYLELPKELPMILFDPDQLKQVLLNLITNAAEAMPQGGAIYLSAYCEEFHVLLSIRDTGKGIPRELEEKIFEPYFTTEKTTGYGIGLFIAKQICQKNGAALSLQSMPGKGCVFTLRCPRATISPDA